MQRGFSLIELLVVFALIAVITSLGFAAFSAYNSSQVVQSSTSDVANVLNTAKARALSQVKPDVCSASVLEGYEVTIAQGAQTYTLSVVCNGRHQLLSQSLPPQVTFSSDSTQQIRFGIGGVTSSASITIKGYGKTKTIMVNGAGRIEVN